MFHKHPLELQTLDSKIANGIMKIVPADFKKKIDFLEETQYKNKRPTAHGEAKLCFKYFCSSNIIKTLEHMMDLSDLLEVELRNDNLKMLNQAWEGNIISPW